MKRSFYLSIFLFLVLAACAADLATQKRKAEDRRNIAAAYMSQQNYTEALRELLEAEKLYAKDPYLQHDLGYAYMQKEKPVEAIEHFQKALELKHDFSSAKNNLGVAYLKNQQWDQAIACFRELSENLLYATPQNALVNLGSAYYQKKDLAQAEFHYKKALALYEDGMKKDIGYVQASHGLGITYLAMGRNPEAVAVLERAVQFAPRIPEVLLTLGEAYAGAKNYAKAIESYSRVQELVPERTLAHEAARAIEKIKERTGIHN